jgi:hypothetical protein
LKHLVDPETGGDPTTGRKFTRRSLRYLSEHLQQRACPDTIARLLRGMDFSLRVNVKRFTGPPHPDRNLQFEYLRQQEEEFLEAGLPVISVDTKNKELIGNFKNSGRSWRIEPFEVNAHDFRQDALCRAAPYGIYDVTHNLGHFCVGISADTSRFAVDALREWWRTKGVRRYPEAEQILVEADAGGSNGCRPRLWKASLQEWADTEGLEITVSHYPTGASKWNAVEHRLFGPVSINWSGIPLTSLDHMLSLLRGTTTKSGLKVTAVRNTKRYQKGIRITKQEMHELNIQYHDVCPNWNYTIIPRT